MISYYAPEHSHCSTLYCFAHRFTTKIIGNRGMQEPCTGWHGASNESVPESNGSVFEEMAMMTKRILLADDDPGVRELLGRVLESEHYQVSFARTGIEAARKFAAEAPDLVLLDINMPGKNGWESFGQMYDRHPFIPVIVITARPNQYQQAVSLGVDALMEKPLNLPVLLTAVRRLLAESEGERTRRLTDRDFKTALLSQADPAGGD
jgi:CheY-like chemotaxis protein